MTDTIFALASAAGRAGVAVIRLSGPKAKQVEEHMAKRPLQLPRTMYRGRWQNADGVVLDDGLAVFFPAPKSYTGEDVVEIHCHGGRATLNSLFNALAAFAADVRSAERGEFTRRAFENGKMDLTAAEGLADLIDAETDMQRRIALQQMGGALADLYEGWRDRLIKILAYWEAWLDFPEEDVPDDLNNEVEQKIRALINDLTQHLQSSTKTEKIREGFEVVILGAPNAGKSSLLNHIAKDDVAIVSNQAGTTRDVLEVHLDIEGLPVILVDTAGLRESLDSIEQEGIRRALKRSERADITILLLDGEAWQDQLKAHRDQGRKVDLIVVNKVDLLGTEIPQHPDVDVWMSVKADDGIAILMDKLHRLLDHAAYRQEAPVLTRTRHRLALEECAQHLEHSLHAPLPELKAEDMRMATRALGRITGRVDVEDLLDLIFRDFCIGK